MMESRKDESTLVLIRKPRGVHRVADVSYGADTNVSLSHLIVRVPRKPPYCDNFRYDGSVFSLLIQEFYGRKEWLVPVDKSVLVSLTETSNETSNETKNERDSGDRLLLDNYKAKDEDRSIDILFLVQLNRFLNVSANMLCCTLYKGNAALPNVTPVCHFVGYLTTDKFLAVQVWSSMRIQVRTLREASQSKLFDGVKKLRVVEESLNDGNHLSRPVDLATKSMDYNTSTVCPDVLATLPRIDEMVSLPRIKQGLVSALHATGPLSTPLHCSAPTFVGSISNGDHSQNDYSVPSVAVGSSASMCDSPEAILKHLWVDTPAGTYDLTSQFEIEAVHNAPQDESPSTGVHVHDALQGEPQSTGDALSGDYASKSDSDNILSAMDAGITMTEYEALVEMARSGIFDSTTTTATLIETPQYTETMVGFVDESDPTFCVDLATSVERVFTSEDFVGLYSSELAAYEDGTSSIYCTDADDACVGSFHQYQIADTKESAAVPTSASIDMVQVEQDCAAALLTLLDDKVLQTVRSFAVTDPASQRVKKVKRKYTRKDPKA
jgi:hypothetical protein